MGVLIRILFVLALCVSSCFVQVLLSNNIAFIANHGQWKRDVIAKAHIPNGVLIIKKNKWTFQLFDYSYFKQSHCDCIDKHEHNNTLDAHNIEYCWLGAQENSRIIFSEAQDNYSNFFRGKDRSKWASKVPHHKSLTIKNLYNGVDLKLYSFEGQLKYDYIVHENHLPNEIKLKIAGADSLYIVDDALNIENGIDNIIETLPLCYQNKPYKEIKGTYSLNGNLVSYQFEQTPDINKELTIDPSLVFSTYSGSYVPNWGFTATHDLGTNTYSGGTVFNAIVTDTFPTTPGAFQLVWGGGAGSGFDIEYSDAVIMKYDNTGQLLFSTFLGGYGGERPHSLTINNKNELIILGTTSALDFPVTAQAYDTSGNGGWDIFVSKLSADGTQLIASTYMGGSDDDGVNIDNNYNVRRSLKFNYADDSRGDISVDENFNIYIASCTKSSDFPTTTYAFQKIYGGGDQDAIVFKFDDNLSHLMYSTFLGGDDDDAAYSAVYKDQVTYITGGTRSSDYPVTTNAIQTSFGGDTADAFISSLNLDGSQLLASTYWGGDRYDQSYFVQLDDESNVYLLGQTMDTNHYFLVNQSYHDTNGGQFITKFNPELDSVIFSMTFGSDLSLPDISPSAFLVDVCEKIFLSGWGGPLMSGQLQYMDLPVTSNAYKDTTDGQDYYMMVLDKDASALVYASYIGSPFRGDHVDGGTSRFDKRGIMHQAVCAGCGADNNFPTTPGAWSNTNNSTNCNTGTFQFDFEFPTLNTEFSMDHTSGCYPLDVNFASQTSISDSISVDFFWDFGDGSSDTLANPTHQYSEPGQYEASLIISDPNTCNIRDTLTKTIRVITDSARQISDISICQGGSAQIGVLPDIDSSATYQWIPGSELSDNKIANPIAFPDSTMAYKLLISSGSCTDTLHQKVFVLNGESDSLPTQEICIYDTIQIGIINTNNFDFHWEPNYMISDTGMALTIAYPDTTTNYRLIVQNQFCGDTLKQKIKVKYPVVWGFDQDTSICRGQNIQIGMPDTFGVDYEWAPSLYLNNNSFSRPISIPDSSISYTLLSNQEACRLADSISITVLDVPSLSISSDENICYGDSVQLNAIGDLGYIWLPDTNISETNISSPTAYPITTTFYSVLTWNIYNCYVKDSIKISVAPPLSVEIGEQDSICLGDSYQLNASITEPGSPGSPAPYAYTWSPVAYLNYTNLSNPVSTPGESIKYYLDVTDGQLCEATDSIFIYISPVAPDSLAKDTSICINDSILIGFTDTLTALNYQWHPNTGIINDSASLTWASPQTSTNYILTPDDTLCQKPDSIFIEIFSLPIVNSAPDTTICSGDTIQLLAEGGNIYNWDKSNGLSDSSIFNPLCFSPDSITYVVLITDSNGCNKTDTLQINTLYAPQIDLGSDTSICYNTSALIGISDTSSGFYWSPSTFLTDSNSGSSLCIPDSSITYILSHINSACVMPDTIYVNVFSKPSIILSPDTSVCFMDSLNLFIEGGYQYQWSSVLNLLNQLTDSPQAIINDSASIFVTIIDSNSCLIYDSLYVNSISFPSYNIGNDTQMCFGDSIYIGFPDSNDLSFSWQPNYALGKHDSSFSLAYPDTSIWYVLIPSDLRCLSKDSIRLQVNPLPDINTQIDTGICYLDSILLWASGAKYYVWRPDTIIDSPFSDSTWSYPKSNTLFTLTSTDSNNCISTDSIMIQILETPVFDLGSDTNLCRGDSILLDKPDNSSLTHIWQPGYAVSDSIADTLIVFAKNSVLILLTKTLGSCTYSDSIFLNIDPISPMADFGWNTSLDCEGLDVQLINNSLLNNQNYWAANMMSSLESEPHFTLPFDEISTISLVSESDEGCRDSLTKLISVESLKDHILKSMFNVFTPNQDGHNDCFYIFDDSNQLDECGQWEVYNRWGAKVFESASPQECWDGTIGKNKKIAPEGVYFYIFTLGNFSITNYLELIR